MTHEVVLHGYNVKPGSLQLGTFDSYGIEELHVTADDSWDGLDILAVFHAPNGTAKKVVVGADGMLAVPPEATAKQAGVGRIVFVGLAENVQRITVDMGYNIKPHSDIEGDNPGTPTPDVVQQILANSNNAVSIATAAQDAAENARQAAEDAAKKAGEGAGGAAASAAAAKKSAEDAAASSKSAASKAEESASSASAAAKNAKAAQTAQGSAENAAQTAADAAGAARQAAGVAGSAAKASSTSAGEAAQSAEAAETAKQRAEDAAKKALEAKTGSENALQDADAAKDAASGYADAAAEKATAAAKSENSAADSAAAAKKSADDADNTANSIKDSMTQIAENKEAVSKLKEDIVNITNGVKPIYKDIVWQNGYIDNKGIVKESVLSKYAVISLKSTETVLVGTTNVNITMLGKTNSDTVSVGDTVTPIKITSGDERFEECTYYTLKDVNIVVCVLASNYELKFYEKPFFLNEDTKVFHITDYVNGGYYNTGILSESTNRVRTSNFLILNKGEAVDAKNIPYGYELNISFFDFNTKKLKYGDEWGGLYPYVAQEKILMLPVWRRSDNTDLSPSEITGDVVIYGTCLSDIKYNDSVIASNLGIQDKINQANHYRRNDTKPLCLAHISDLHLDKIRLQRFTNFINNIKNIDDAICTGDMTNNYSDGMSYWDSVSGAERILTCIGNHDGLANNNVDWYSGQCTMLEAYNKFINPYISNWNVTYDVGKTYYYKDYNSEKIRLIVLDSMRSGTDATNQNTWLKSVLSSAKSKGYSVVCATHCVPQTSKVNYIDCSFNSINLKYEDEYDTCVTNTIYQQTVQNFIDDDGKFITWICGHTHVDFVYTTSEFPNQLWIVVACGRLSNNLDIDRTDGTKNQDAFNILTFDTNTELVKVIRVGADRDRSMRHLGTMSIDYNTHNVIYND